MLVPSDSESSSVDNDVLTVSRPTVGSCVVKSRPSEDDSVVGTSELPSNVDDVSVDGDSSRGFDDDVGVATAATVSEDADADVVAVVVVLLTVVDAVLPLDDDVDDADEIVDRREESVATDEAMVGDLILDVSLLLPSGIRVGAVSDESTDCGRCDVTDDEAMTIVEAIELGRVVVTTSVVTELLRGDEAVTLDEIDADSEMTVADDGSELETTSVEVDDVVLVDGVEGLLVVVGVELLPLSIDSTVVESEITGDCASAVHRKNCDTFRALY